MARRRPAQRFPKAPEPVPSAGRRSGRPLPRVVAVVLLATMAAFFVVLGARLFLAPPPAMASSLAAMVGLAYLVGALAYGLSARWVAAGLLWGHVVAIVLVAINLLLGFTAHMTWLEWVLLGVNVATLGLLLATVPRRR